MTGKPTRHRKRNIGAIAGGIISGAGAILAVFGMITFVQRQRRRKSNRDRRRSILSFSTDSIEADPQMIVTPFDPNFSESIQVSRITAEQQPLMTEEPSAETVALRPLSSSPPILPSISRPVTPVPAGLSDKELARLRIEALTSQQPYNSQGSTSYVSQTTFSPTAAAEIAGAELPSDTRRLHSEVELLRREMEQIRAEGLAMAAPPSYTEGNG
jgi:hypothetical protein